MRKEEQRDRGAERPAMNGVLTAGKELTAGMAGAKEGARVGQARPRRRGARTHM